MTHQIKPTDKVNRELFMKKLKEETNLLKQWFEDKRFTSGNLQLGNEVEYFLVDPNMDFSFVGDDIIKDNKPDNIVNEVDQCFLECNTQPVDLDNKAFFNLQNNMEHDLSYCEKSAKKLDSEILSIGNNPIMTAKDYQLDIMSNQKRYQILQKCWRPKNLPFSVDISDEIHLNIKNISLLSAAYQIHLRVGVNSSTKYYNAAVAAAAPVLAMSTNSPIFCGKPLWMESRIKFFESLSEASKGDGEKYWKRCTFPTHYLRDSWHEIYQENIDHFPMLLPVIIENSTNPFEHVQMHNSCRYPWVRTVIDFSKNNEAHLRIEFRPLPSGPTIVDMIANTAFFVGLVHALTIKDVELIPYQYAHDNFYQAAQHGLGANMLWHSDKTINVCDLVSEQLLPLAKVGLEACNISEKEINYYLNIIAQRITQQQNGSTWQLAYLAHHDGDLYKMTQEYHRMQKSGMPVHDWRIAEKLRSVANW